MEGRCPLVLQPDRIPFAGATNTNEKPRNFFRDWRAYTVGVGGVNRLDPQIMRQDWRL